MIVLILYGKQSNIPLEMFGCANYTVQYNFVYCIGIKPPSRLTLSQIKSFL